jgi:hypothetical protein
VLQYSKVGIVNKKEQLMTTVEKIQAEIKMLSPEEYADLRMWFFEREWEAWDRQLEADVEDGALDFLVEEALAEKVQGRLKEL